MAAPDYSLPPRARTPEGARGMKLSPSRDSTRVLELKLQLELRRMELEAKKRESQRQFKAEERDNQRQFEFRKLELQRAP